MRIDGEVWNLGFSEIRLSMSSHRSRRHHLVADLEENPDAMRRRGLTEMNLSMSHPAVAPLEGFEDVLKT